MIISDRRQIIIETPKTGLNEAEEWREELKKAGYSVTVTVSARQTIIDAVRTWAK